MAASGFRLLIQQGPRAGQVVDVNRPTMIIGREIGSDIVIEDPQVSRHHARLVLQGGGYVVEDLGSTNGTFVNGRRVMSPVPLNPGDKLALGDTVVMEVQGSSVETMAGRQPGMMPPPYEAPPPNPYGPPPSYEPQPVYDQGGYPPPGYDAPPPPPPPAPRRGPNPALIGCGCLVVLLVFCLVLAFLFYQYAPASMTAPVCDALASAGLGTLCGR